MGFQFMRKGKWYLMIAFIWVLGTSCSSAEESSHQEHGSETQREQVGPSLAVLEIPDEFQPGAQRFQNFCSRCHGVNGVGTDQGPPLVHKIYEPSHHADFAFFRAAAQGVRAHHWKFGNMPKIADVKENDVQEIVKYVRWLQREAGIY